MSIEVRNVSKSFGKFEALKNVSLEVKSGELVAALGPSGCGKTTLLRIIAGLETADSGSILFHGEDATQSKVGDRNVGFVFQHYALFRHMTVFENVAFGLRVKSRAQRPSKAEIREKVTNLLQLVQLEWLADRYPSQLSGGQRQRIALARALAVEPKVLLLDEPFGALDAKVRKDLRRWLRRLHDEIHITSVFVTHDQEEALEVADHIVVMNQGKIEQVGTPVEVYEQPASPFVYNFLGNVNLFHGRIVEGHLQSGSLEVEAPDALAGEERSAIAYVRPYDLDVQRASQNGSTVEVIIQHIHPVGPVVRLELLRRDTQEPLEAELSKDQYRDLALKVGEHVFVSPKNLHIFAEDYSI